MSNFRFFCFALIVLWNAMTLPVEVFGQKGDAGREDGPVGLFSTRGEYEQFMVGAKQAAFGEGGSPELQAMIPMLNDIALAKPMGWSNQNYGGGGSSLDILADPSVRKEIDMLDDQYQQLLDFNASIQNRAVEQLRGLDFGQHDAVVRQLNDFREQAQSELEKLLLPHQLERLRQIELRSQLRRRSLVDILTTNPVKSELEITDDQANEMRAEEEAIKRDLEKEIAKLREKARERLLEKLEPEQKKEVEKMLGDAFEFDEQKSSKQSSSKSSAKKNVK